MTTTRKIGLIGRIDPQETAFDGQTVKTRTIYRMLVERYGHESVLCVDTRSYGREVLRVAAELARCLRECDDIVVSLSRGGRKALFPILASSAKRHGKRIYHLLIGGQLAKNIEEDPSGKLVDYLKSFEVNWVETNKLAADLVALGVRNAEYLPNFKQIEPVVLDGAYVRSTPLRFCTFSRVQREKGISNAIETVGRIDREHGGDFIRLDIYGPVAEGYHAELETLLAENPCAAYCGCVSAEKSVETIRGYDALLFPTEWHAEGVPGTIIDALCAGLPVITSRWSFYGEMLEDGVTGLGYDFAHPELLQGAIESFSQMSDAQIDVMKCNCVTRAETYSADICFAKITERIERSR